MIFSENVLLRTQMHSHNIRSRPIRRIVYTSSKSFRMNLALEKALRELAVQLEQHESDIIRKALWEFIKAHRQIPNSLANET